MVYKNIKEFEVNIPFMECGYIEPDGGVHRCSPFQHKYLDEKFKMEFNEEFEVWSKQNNNEDISDFLVFEKGFAKITCDCNYKSMVVFNNELTFQQSGVVFFK